MSFFDYLDRVFSNMTVDLQGGYNNLLKAEQEAVNWLIGAQRRFYKWIAVPKLIISFFLTKMGILEMPGDKLTAYREQLKKDQAEQAKKVTPIGIVDRSPTDA